MKKIGLAVLLTFGLLTFSYGQQYKTAIGIKGGFPYYGSLDLKHYFGSAAGEFRLGGGRYDFFLQGLYERNYALGGEAGLEWYWGVGGHLGFWNYGHHQGWHHNDKYYDNGVYGGIDAVIGIEYTFQEFPLNLALDCGPAINLFPFVRGYFGGAIAARFAIK